MKGCWLRKNGLSDCLLFMAGWGMGPEPFATVDFGKTDVFMTYDYRCFDDTVLAALVNQNRLHLLGWSMGVWLAAWLAQQGGMFSRLRFHSATALAGTLQPVDNTYGIPVQVFEKMLHNISTEELVTFYSSMFTQCSAAQDFLCCKPERTCEELQDELRHLYEACLNTTEALPDIYTRKIVTGRDQIFPARSQLRAWGRQHCTVASLPHFPFYQQEEEQRLFLPPHPP